MLNLAMSLSASFVVLSGANVRTFFDIIALRVSLSVRVKSYRLTACRNFALFTFIKKSSIWGPSEHRTHGSKSNLNGGENFLSSSRQLLSSENGPREFVKLGESEFVNEALKIVETAQSRQVNLRILGALTVYVHSLDKSDCTDAFKHLGRFGEGQPVFTDLDLGAYGRQKKEINKVFQDLKFKPDMMVNALFGNRRLIFYHPKNMFHVDIFLDKLEFSHDVKFGDKPGSGRLELDYPTITLEDIVLEKLQIHNINRKDLIDLIVLFMGHEVSAQNTKDFVAGNYVANVLCEDWGFWYDATTNLEKVKSLAIEFENSAKLSHEQVSKALSGIARLTEILEKTPKTDRWKIRAKVGSSKPWFREVEEVQR